MCNLGANLRLMDLPVEAFECWWKALQISPINWDILVGISDDDTNFSLNFSKDNMLETFLGSNRFNETSLGVFNGSNTPQTPQIHRQALRVCSFVLGHLPENPVRMEEVHRAQNTFCLRALLLQSLQEAGGWGDLVDGIEIGINTTFPLSSSPAGSIRPEKTTFDDLLLQIHYIGTSICDNRNPDTSSPGGTSPTAAVKQEGPDVLRPPEGSGWKILQPTLLLFPEEVLRLPLKLWPSTHGSPPSIVVSTAPGNAEDDVWTERVKALTKTATSRLLHTWATKVQDFLEAQSLTGRDHTASAPVPCSIFQGTKSLVVLAEYLALALSPTAMSYNELGILLSAFDSQLRVSRSSRSGSLDETAGHNLSRVYFEVGLEVEPQNAHLLTNLGSYWKKGKNYEEAIRFVSPLSRAL